MEKSEFLEQHVFNELKKVKTGVESVEAQSFSESDFEIILKRIEHFGIGAYKIEAWQEDKVVDTSSHEDFKKKVTDSSWYKKAFLTLKTRQAGLSYSASYKISPKLLARDPFVASPTKSADDVQEAKDLTED
ncbi:MAG TPA: hypothetical protein DCS15_05945 [Flavobacteriales bacterium]|jgi:hypothetical protein|nr:hypothetical protein [Flavobacteriales bacterium]